MEYHEMTINDYHRVLELWKETDGVRLRGADSREGIDKYLKRNPGLSFVALDQERVVGSIMAGHDGKRGYIQHLAVAPDSRKQGIATFLVDLCLDALKAEGILKSHLMVLHDNSAAKQFWYNRGWGFRSDIDIYSYINSDDENV